MWGGFPVGLGVAMVCVALISLLSLFGRYEIRRDGFVLGRHVAGKSNGSDRVLQSLVLRSESPKNREGISVASTERQREHVHPSRCFCACIILLV